MRSGKELILATKRYAVDCPLKSWWCVLSTIVFLAVAIVGTLLNFGLAGRIVCSCLTGLLILRLFVIYHDQQHQAILPKSGVANFLMSVFGILALSPTSVWSKSHNHHHNHNSRLRGSNIGSFPIGGNFSEAKQADRDVRSPTCVKGDAGRPFQECLLSCELNSQEASVLIRHVSF
jgi:acyl-lipid omega-6 desaturase (Delta-12 desaturase)